MKTPIYAMLRSRRSLFGLGSFLLLLLAVAVFLPSRVHVERSIVVDAPRATVFALANDFRQIGKWSAWADNDPNAHYSFSGAARGEGASMSWDGNIIGHGSQRIVESIPYDKVVTALELGSRGDARSTVELASLEYGTEVTWSFDASYGLNLLGRFAGLTDERNVGRDFEAGLVNLKSMAERLPRADFSTAEIETLVVDAQDIAFLSATSIPLAAAISEEMGDAYFKVLNFMDQYGLVAAGPAISISRGYRGNDLTFDAAIPVSGIGGDTPHSALGVKLGTTYAGPVIRAKHVGSYVKHGQTHDKIAAYLAALGLERNGDTWESYVSDPTRTAEAELITYVYYPIRGSADRP
jgi:effector-binding domain-containing protein